MRDAGYAIDKWLTACPEPKHDWICNCSTCHEYHDVQAKYQDVNFECCTNDVEDMIAEGHWCSKKPKEHGLADMQGGICLACLGGY